MAVHAGKLFSRFSIRCKADASELLENIEEMFPRYYMHSNKDNYSVFTSKDIN